MRADARQRDGKTTRRIDACPAAAEDGGAAIRDAIALDDPGACMPESSEGERI